MTADREEGFYWVRALSYWTVAWWSGADWKFVGSGNSVSSDSLDEIGNRIERPSE